jgi:GT2 family glycosyltransferase
MRPVGHDDVRQTPAAVSMLLILIVNYRTPELTLDCLRSLRNEVAGHGATRVVVVDNDSGDGSADVIERGIAADGLSAWAALVRSPRNGGFAYGNNAGLRAATEGQTPLGRVIPDVVWLLNPDTIVRAGAVAETLAFLQTHPEVGVVGTGIENEDGSTWLSAFHFPSVWSELEHALAFGPFTRLIGQRAALYPPATAPRRVEWVSGASMLVRYSVVEKLGFLDEDYFMYFEETDFCLAAARAGVECWQVPGSRVVHLLGKSSGVTGSEANVKRRPRYWFASRERYYRKNHGAAYLHLTNLLWCAAYPLGKMQRWLRRKPRHDPPRLWRDLLRYAYLEPKP